MSEVKVNKISPKQTCTTVTLGDSGDDFVVASGVNFKTAAVKDAAGNVIVSRCGSNITIGSCGAAVSLACGATQTGFGRTGTVDWDTTAKTASFTAVSGAGYFVNTTGGAITVTLPSSPSGGDIVAISDYAGTAITNNITIARNGSNINGAASDLTISAENSAVTLIYVDGTEGWKTTYTSNTNNLVALPAYVTATGGTVTCCGDYKIHTFTGPGTFTVTCAGNPLGSATVDYLVVAGGGGGGGSTSPGGGGAGGGAGGFRESVPSPAAWSASPLANPGGSLPVAVQGYPITVGAGGSPKGPGAFVNGAGSNSIFSTITSAGGGDGGMFNSPGQVRSPATIDSNGAPSTSTAVGGSGGSGGGGSYFNSLGGLGNNPPVVPSQGNNGGTGSAAPQYSAAGGGGAGAVGSNATPGAGGNGGNGATTSISGSPTAYAGGGGGSSTNSTDGTGGTGGGGNGTSPGGTGGAGSTNTGGGGGGGGSATDATGGAGGSGIVIIRYKFQ